MPPQLIPVDDLASVPEAEIRDVLRAYYDELTDTLCAWGVPLGLQEPAKRVFSAARQHIGYETGSVLAWGLKPWLPIANRTPADLLREPGGDQLILQAFAHN